MKDDDGEHEEDKTRLLEEEVALNLKQTKIILNQVRITKEFLMKVSYLMESL